MYEDDEHSGEADSKSDSNFGMAASVADFLQVRRLSDGLNLPDEAPVGLIKVSVYDRCFPVGTISGLSSKISATSEHHTTSCHSSGSDKSGSFVGALSPSGAP